jgi:hypothetical protein
MRRIGIALGVLLLLAAAAVLAVRQAGMGRFGAHEEPGTPRTTPRAVVLPAAPGAKQILYGDLHVHTTFSDDAFSFSLPTLGGEGAHPPADACDFARFCSALDFWSINDHAERLTPRHWREIVRSIRQCNDVIADPANPDTVAFLGWEWTQIGDTVDNHYGHKNVVLAETDDASVPTRPIGAARPASRQLVQASVMARGIAALTEGGRFHDFARYQAEAEATAICPSGVPVRELPADCIELAATPAELFEKLDDWGHDAIVIPHGTSWGMYTPPGSRWDKQLAGAQHDEQRQTLIEVMSGHGDSEVYRDWKDVDWDAEGRPLCPAPRPDYLPSCWRAGEIIRERCAADGESADECERRALEARANFVAAGLSGHLTVPGASAEEWLDAGQCRDCRTPSFNYRPRSSVQYILALGNFDAGASPRRFRFGVIAASDNHFARPGTGYKPVRLGHSEAMNGAARPSGEGIVGRTMAPPRVPAQPRSLPFDPTGLSGFQLFETERQQSYLTTGGLTAVHADGRDRAAIWRALKRREVFGTSGHRIQLWFDLVNPPAGAPGSVAPMGSEVALAGLPRRERGRARARRRRAPVPRRVSQSERRAPPDHAHRDRAHPAPARARRADRAARPGSLADGRVHSRRRGLRRERERPRLRGGWTRDALLRARVRGARPDGEWRRRALRARRTGQLRARAAVRARGRERGLSRAGGAARVVVADLGDARGSERPTGEELRKRASRSRA